jgi:hypothetical protein
MITKYYLFKPIFFLFTGLLMVTGLHGQHLPDKQTVSIRAPSAVKIDGNADEWPEQLQAHNHATDIYYTIANDDNYLYLCIEATQQDVINKIVNGGITFSIHKYGDKKDKNNVVSVTYPVFEGDPLFFIIKGKNSEDASAGAVNTLVKTYNKRLEQKCKSIGIKGVPSLDDPLSVYNTDGIKVVGRFNTKKTYVCEFALAIKYLKMAGSEPFKFSYHLVVNGATSTGRKPMFEDDGKPHPPMFDKIFAKQAVNDMATDFWANYTMAGK